MTTHLDQCMTRYHACADELRSTSEALYDFYRHIYGQIHQS